MMNWFKTSNQPHPERKKVEPGATFSLFENHWMQAVSVMESSANSDAALAVISHLSQMISFLGMTRAEPASDKSCKSFWLHHRCSDTVIKWLHTLQIRGLELPPGDEIKLVAMLHSLCEAASRDGELLGYLKNDNEIKAESWDGAYALASLLLEYSHRGDVELSETARYSFIMLIQLAPRYPGLERSLSQETGLGLTNVVVSGLSACFAQLPTFHEANPELLGAFVDQIKFVDNVTSAGSPVLASNIADCFLNAFLLAIIEPAMTQDGDGGNRSLHKQHDLSYFTSLNEEIGIVTFYLQIICQNLTHPALIRSLIHFINSKLLDTLIHRLDHVNESVCVAVSTLSLFNVLYEFYCEDFWFEVVLKYLLSQNHLMVSQRNSLLPKVDFYDSAMRFLNLIPLSTIETLGSDTITAHYVQYVNSESQRWLNLDTLVGSTFSVLPTEDSSNSESDKTNPVYPKWKRRYNGTDVAVLKVTNDKRNLHENVTRMESQDRHATPISHNGSIAGSHGHDPLSSPEYLESPFTTINLQPGPSNVEQNHQSYSAASSSTTENGVDRKKTLMEDSIPVLEKLSVLTNNSSDEYGSFDSSGSPVSDDPSNTIGSLGPFLDKVFVQLSNWANLDLNVILMLTDVVSILASSRIPLLTSLLLDPTLTLQPCYTSFMTLLKRIRGDLEYHMQKVPSEVLLHVWELMNPKETQNYRRTSYGTSGMLELTSVVQPSSSLGEQIGETIRRRISGSGAGGAIANVLHMFNRKINNSPTTGPRIHPSSGTEQLMSPDTNMNRGDRYWNRHAETLDASGLMAMRMIFFSHWLLELAAIAHQLSWKPAYD